MSSMHFSPRTNRAHEIKWREWGEAAFDEAREQGKPVLLGISAVWCHWCHVMDETTYSDPAIIELLNEKYVPVRVDNDQRPDVNARYNMGGWPTTAILSPEGEILHGGTYVPPEAMSRLLAQIGELYADSEKRLAIAKRIGEVRSERAGRARAAQAGPLDARAGEYMISSLFTEFDAEFGGFGSEPKFPQMPVQHFLLDWFARSADWRAQEMCAKTLRGMSSGGMYDHVDGGFFRYSTTRDWSVPHFEKMLEDLSGELLACARASAMFGEEKLGKVALDVKRYLDERLWNSEFGGYGGSQDADEDFYKLDAEGRKGRSQPYVDPTLYTAWNAEAAQALIIAGPLLEAAGADSRNWIERGLAILETLWSKLLVDGLMARWYDGEPHLRGLLVDQAWSAWAALSAYAATADSRWLERAGALIEAAEALYDSTAEGYLDRQMDPSQPGRGAEPAVPMDENALMARVLLSYSSYTGRNAWAERAKAVLSRFSKTYRSVGMFAATYASAVLDVLDPPLDLKIIGTADSPKCAALKEEALRLTAPPLRVDVIDPKRDSARLDNLGYLAAGEPAGYICRDHACFARVAEPAELISALKTVKT